MRVVHTAGTNFSKTVLAWSVVLAAFGIGYPGESPAEVADVPVDEDAFIIEWPAAQEEAILSDKDKVNPVLAEYDSPFEFTEEYA